MGLRLWLQSQRDLRTARFLLTPETYYASSNYAHQAAEKALKAGCWLLRNEEPPWKHDLVRCLDLLSVRTDDVPSSVRLAVEQLQPLFDATRYPSGNAEEPIPADLIDRDEAERGIRQSEEVVEWVRELLPRTFSY